MSDYEATYQMTKDVEEAIEKSLPSQVATILKKRLEEADALQEEVAELSNRNQVQAHSIDELREAAKQHGYLQGRESEVEEKEQEVNEREKKLDVTILENKLVSADSVISTLANFMSGLARNIEFRKNFSGDVPLAGGGTTYANNDTTETAT